MTGKRVILAAVVTLLISASPALAEHLMTLTKTANPIMPSYPGTSLDILGVKPGMSVNATKAKLKAFYGTKPSVDKGGYYGSAAGLSLKSQPSIWVLRDQKSNADTEDAIIATFSMPTTGVTVVAVDRTIDFKTEKSQPTVKQLFSALDKKYGKETGTKNARSAAWMFGKKGLLKHCPNGDSQCRCDTQFDPSNPAYFQGEVSQNKYFCIVATASGGYDIYHADQLDIKLASPIDMLISAKAAVPQFKAAGIAASKHEATAKVPKL